MVKLRYEVENDDLMQSLFSRLSQIAILDPLDQLPKIIRKNCAGFSWMLHGDVEAIPHRLGGDRGSAACFLDFASVIFVIESYVVEEHRNPRPHGQGNPGFAGDNGVGQGISRIIYLYHL